MELEIKGGNIHCILSSSGNKIILKDASKHSEIQNVFSGSGLVIIPDPFSVTLLDDETREVFCENVEG